MADHTPEVLGIVAKRRDAPYRSGYVDTWLKMKCTQQDSFAVIGHEPAGRSGVRTLRIARLFSGELQPCGSVGSGLTDKSSRDIWAALEAGQPVVVDVDYRGWAPSGELRHPVLKGWHVG